MGFFGVTALRRPQVSGTTTVFLNRQRASDRNVGGKTPKTGSAEKKIPE
jgi:hypothetical protein